MLAYASNMQVFNYAEPFQNKLKIDFEKMNDLNILAITSAASAAADPRTADGLKTNSRRANGCFSRVIILHFSF